MRALSVWVRAPHAEATAGMVLLLCTYLLLLLVPRKLGAAGIVHYYCYTHARARADAGCPVRIYYGTLFIRSAFYMSFAHYLSTTHCGELILCMG